MDIIQLVYNWRLIMDNNTREKVENVLSDVMERIIDKRINKEPFKEEEISLKILLDID